MLQNYFICHLRWKISQSVCTLRAFPAKSNISDKSGACVTTIRTMVLFSTDSITVLSATMLSATIFIVMMSIIILGIVSPGAYPGGALSGKNYTRLERLGTYKHSSLLVTKAKCFIRLPPYGLRHFLVQSEKKVFINLKDSKFYQQAAQ